MAASCLILLAGCSVFKKTTKDDIAETTKEVETTTKETAAKEEPITVKISKPSTTPEQANRDRLLIMSHLKRNQLVAQTTPSGLQYIIEREGTEEIPADAKVTVHYEGTLLNGKKFDSSYDRGKPNTFSLKGLIEGWQEGIPLIKKGGMGWLFIPSALAYKDKELGNGLIPANSVLVFKLEVIDVE